MELNNRVTTERLELILAETLGTTAARGEHASVEVNAALFVGVLTEALVCRCAHTNFMMPSRIPNIERRSPQEVEDICRAMLRNMFARAGLQLHDQPEDNSDLPPVFTCSECGLETSDPEGRHYCHEDNSDE